MQSKDNIAFFNSARRPDREHTVKWVGPLQHDTIYLYEATRFPQKITTLDQAKKVTAIYVLNGNAHDTYLTNKGFTNVHRAGHYEACFHMLIKRRVNLAANTNTSLLETLDAAHIGHGQIQPAIELYQSQGYLTMSKNISDAIVASWQGALDKLKNNGRYDYLYRQYMEYTFSLYAQNSRINNRI